MMNIAEQLRIAGVVVIEGRAGIGLTVGVDGIDVLATGTGQSHEGADDINNIVTPARAVAYIERDGRVWLLADGPVMPGPAVVYLAQYRDAPTVEQGDVLDVLVAVLGDVYGLSAPNPASDALDGDIGAVEDSEEDDSEEDEG
jgi:hypothetical protein